MSASTQHLAQPLRLVSLPWHVAISQPLPSAKLWGLLSPSCLTLD